VGGVRWDFTGEVALVTGSAAGIGAAIAAALVEAGARVHGLDVSEPDARPEAAAGSYDHHAVDLRDGAAVRSAIEAVLAAEGRIDHVVNVAGITRDRALWNLTDEDWDAVLDVNLSGAFRVLRAVAPYMRAQGRGSVVQVASVNGLRGKFGQANYAASKAGLIGLTRVAARELGPRGIRVNAVAPGMIDTAMARAVPDEVRSRAVAETTLGRLGLPEEVAAAVLFLLSDAAALVTGEVVRVDGGQLA
jgi:acetoacetyl-CoA reductase/3-oxoacyl-[acyl-carrier protein] reductase